MSSQVRLRLLPSARCLFDEPVQVKVAGLRSRQVVTTRARATDERGVVFTSSATYRADESGEIDLDRDPSLSGSYVGVEPMGLLWSMKADTLHKYFFKNNALNPHVVIFSVHEEGGEGRMLAEATNERFLMGDGVSRLPVKQGNFQGVLFTPPGEGPFPAVLDLCTFMSEKRASLLANKGFVVLAVAVHAVKAENLREMHLDHFKEAVDFLLEQPKVGSKGVGIISRSKGADIALSLAAFVPGVEVIVWINGSSANVGLPLYYKQRKILSPLLMDFSKVILTESGASIIKYAVENPQAEENKATLIPIEQAEGRFLFVVSEDDLNWDSKAFMDDMVERLKRHGKDNFESVCYPRAGHILEPPYGPFCPSATHGLLNRPVLWGGEPHIHAAAEVHMWKKIQEFLGTHLRCDATPTKACQEEMSSQARLRLLPSTRCLFDEPVQVKVAGLRSRQVVTMRARATDEKGVAFSSSATYRADGSGEIDLDRDPSLSGSYVGVEPMGLLWSMKADTLHKRFQKINSLNPHVVKFSVHEEEEEGEGRMLAEATNERFLMGDGVSRLAVKEGNIRGVLFTPPGEGPFPAVLDLYTFGGGLSEKRAALLASRGFVTLTVALYGHDDMPKKMKEVHLDYFEEAIEFLKKQDKVCSKGVGVISISKSGDLALSVASYLSGVAATVWINGCSANTALPLFYKKSQILPALMFDLSKLIPTESGVIVSKYAMHNPLAEENKATLVPIEQAEGRFLFVAAEDDLNWDSKAYVDMMEERLKRHGKDNFESVCYRGAGHYLEPPYGPYCSSSFHGLVGKPVVWGGEPRSHAAAEVHMWKKIQEFFRTHLSSDATQKTAKL
ncbi:acyl-coenzyme A thioesterase 2, mitochondrial-like [Symphorus nematophorus]